MPDSHDRLPKSCTSFFEELFLPLLNGVFSSAGPCHAIDILGSFHLEDFHRVTADLRSGAKASQSYAIIGSGSLEEQRAIEYRQLSQIGSFLTLIRHQISRRWPRQSRESGRLSDLSIQPQHVQRTAKEECFNSALTTQYAEHSILAQDNVERCSECGATDFSPLCQLPE